MTRGPKREIIRLTHDIKQVYIRLCFPDAATADAFRNRFGGECLTHAPGNGVRPGLPVQRRKTPRRNLGAPRNRDDGSKNAALSR
jgi:hypothetical protein